MKNVINYFYNFNIDNIRMIDDSYYFIYQNKKFIFQEIKDINFDYQAVFELNKSLITNGKPFFQIIINKDNQMITVYSNKRYILMSNYVQSDRTAEFNDILDANLTVNSNSKIINRLNRSNWNELWKSKIDYFENFINHNINKYLIINKYLNYFIGIGESAIMYFEDTIKESRPGNYDNLVVSHKRIYSDNSLKRLYNPLELVIDRPSRDIAEYLKTLFWSDSYRKHNISMYFNSFNLSDYGARLIIARLLFPSFFFDEFEKVVLGSKEEKTVLHIIDRVNEYEKYILNIYNILRPNYSIPEINWLKKADYSSTFITPNTSGTSFINIDSMPSFNVTSIMLQ